MISCDLCGKGASNKIIGISGGTKQYDWDTCNDCYNKFFAK